MFTNYFLEYVILARLISFLAAHFVVNFENQLKPIRTNVEGPTRDDMCLYVMLGTWRSPRD